MTPVKQTKRDGTGQPNREAGDKGNYRQFFVRHSAGRNKAMVQYLKAWLDLHFAMNEEEGQGLVEYALIIVLISFAAIAIMVTLGSSITGVFSSISTTLSSHTTTSS
jgi:pilus assembly protein Flp/PilA